MNDDLKDMLAEWGDPLGSRTMSDAEDLIHALQVEIGGLNGHLKALEHDLRYYKLRGDPTGFDMKDAINQTRSIYKDDDACVAVNEALDYLTRLVNRIVNA